MNRLLYQPDREIVATPSVAFSDVWVPTEDGEQLHAWWVPATAPPIASVLLCHGNGGNIGDRALAVDLLAAHGFGVLSFDYRGYGRSSGRPSERGTASDARAARAALPDGPVIYLGESLGGAVALALAVHYPFIPRAFVPDAYPSLRRVRALRAPLLVLHGDDDRVVPVIDGQALYEAAPGPKRIELFPGAGHNDVIGPGWIDVISDWARLIL
jgi:pimeloyl-ACP methyl ester carboxylesterase